MPDELQFSRPLVSVAELAEVLGVSIFTVHYHIREGHIPTERLGNQHVIKRAIAQQILTNYRRNKTWST